MKVVLRASRRRSFGRGPFQIARVFPGLPLKNPDDHGLGPLGIFDHGYLSPGLLVEMHEHRNDEIFSYIRSGTLIHEDTTGAKLPLDSTHLCMMNSGSGISHEESIPNDGESVEMLQIFIRPSEADLPPQFQYHELAQSKSPNKWRRLAAPDESALFQVRNQVWISDCALTTASVDVAPDDRYQLVYVFSGSAESDECELEAGDALLMGQGSGAKLNAYQGECQLVLFQVDIGAKVSRAGTLSG